MYLFKHKDGYSNIPKLKTAAQVKNNTSFFLNRIKLVHTEVCIVNDSTHKSFKFTAEQAAVIMQQGLRYVSFEISGTLNVNGLAFNTANGPFLKNANCQINGKLINDKTENKLWILPGSEIIANQNPIMLSGYVYSKSTQATSIRLISKNIGYQWASAVLNQKLNTKIKPYAFNGAVNCNVLLNMVSGYTHAQIKIRPVSEISLAINGVGIKAHEFVFSFNNRFNKNAAISDNNSIIQIKNIKATTEGIPLNGYATLFNLSKPFIQTVLSGLIELGKPNQLQAPNLIFTQGSLKYSIDYKGSVSPFYNAQAGHVNGNLLAAIEIGNVSFINKKNGYRFTSLNSNIVIENNDLVVDKMTCAINGNTFQIAGNLKAVVPFLFDNSKALQVVADINAPLLNIDSLWHKDDVATAKSNNTNQPKYILGMTIEALLDRLNVQAKLTVDKIVFGPIQTNKATGNFEINDSQIGLKNLMFNEGNGVINATVLVKTDVQKINIDASVGGVQVDKFMESNNDFGQDKIVHQQVEGNLNAILKYEVQLNKQFKVMPATAHGTLDFELQNGRIKNMAGLSKVADFVFKHKNLSDITFQDIVQHATITGNNINIQQLDIASSVLSMRINGVYSLNQQTDLSIQVPLKNLSRKNTVYKMTIEDLQNYSGANVYFRAYNKDDGSMHIAYDPLKKFRKKSRKNTN